jgi:hypothetical protein
MTSIQYINNTSLLINNGESLLLTNPWCNTAFGKWLPSPPTCIHPVYLTSLAEENKEVFSILISNIKDDSFDEKYLKLFPKDVNIIIPKRESNSFKLILNNMGFNNIEEIGHKTKINNNIIKSHSDGTITIETLDAFIIHSNKNSTFSQESEVSIDKHLQDYKGRSRYKNGTSDKIILATSLNLSFDDYPNIYGDYNADEEGFVNILKREINKSQISSINIGAKYLFYYGGDSHYFIKNKKIPSYKSASFYRGLIKEHLLDKITFLDLIPGDKFDFEKIHGMFGEFKYSKETLKNNSLTFYKNEFT